MVKKENLNPGLQDLKACALRDCVIEEGGGGGRSGRGGERNGWGTI